MSLSLTIHITCALLSDAAFLIAFLSGVLFLMQDHQLKHKHMGVLFHRLPSLGRLDFVNFISISTGFVLLTCGTVLGFIGAGQLMGRWWNGDPKEVMTVMLWGAYCALWIVRVRSKLRGRRVAMLSVAGFSLVLLTFLGASWVVPSWHPNIGANIGASHL